MIEFSRVAPTTSTIIALRPAPSLERIYLFDVTRYRVVNKKVFHKSEEKMRKKLKMVLQRAKNLVHVKQQYGVSFLH